VYDKLLKHRQSFRITPVHFNITLPSNLGLLSGLSSSGFPIKALHAFYMTHAFHMSCPSHPPWYDHRQNILSGVKFMEPHIMQLSPSSCHSPLFRPKYFFSVNYSRTLSANVLPSTFETKFHTHIKQQTQL